MNNKNYSGIGAFKLVYKDAKGFERAVSNQKRFCMCGG